MSLKRAAIGILVLLALFPGSCIMNEKIAHYRAESICASAELGAPFKSVEEIVRRDGPPVREVFSYSDDSIYIKPDRISAVYWSFRGFDSWGCHILFVDGKVSEKEVRFTD